MVMTQRTGRLALGLLAALVVGCGAGPTQPTETSATQSAITPAQQATAEAPSYSLQQYGYGYYGSCRRACAYRHYGYYGFRRCLDRCRFYRYGHGYGPGYGRGYARGYARGYERGEGHEGGGGQGGEGGGGQGGEGGGSQD